MILPDEETYAEVNEELTRKGYWAEDENGSYTTLKGRRAADALLGAIQSVDRKKIRRIASTPKVGGALLVSVLEGMSAATAQGLAWITVDSKTQEGWMDLGKALIAEVLEALEAYKADPSLDNLSELVKVSSEVEWQLRVLDEIRAYEEGS